MMVKVHLFKVKRTPYLSTLSDLGHPFLEKSQGEAGSRAQSEGCCESTLALTGRDYGKTDSLKNVLKSRWAQIYKTHTKHIHTRIVLLCHMLT